MSVITPIASASAARNPLIMKITENIVEYHSGWRDITQSVVAKSMHAA